MSGWKKRSEFIKRRLKKIKTWHMVTVLIIMIILAIIFMRINNTGMVELRDQVLAADESGDAKALQQAASELQTFVSRHMNADTGQIALQNSYDTAVEQAFAAVNDDIDASGYGVATEHCKAVLATSGYQGYAACVAAAVGVSESRLATPELPNPALFYISFASPLISFDLAGISVVMSAIIFIAIIAKLLTEVIVHILLYKRR